MTLRKKSNNHLLKLICRFIVLVLVCPLGHIPTAQAKLQAPIFDPPPDIPQPGNSKLKGQDPLFKQSANFSASGQLDTDAQMLRVSQWVEKRLTNYKPDRYQLLLDANRFCRVTVKQTEVDVRITLIEPDNTKLKADTPNIFQDDESVLFVTKVSGTYQLEVQAVESGNTGGNYQIILDELRATNEKDKDLMQAQQFFEYAMKLYVNWKEKNLSDVRERLGKSLDLWKILNDLKGQMKALYVSGVLSGESGDIHQSIKYLEEALQYAREAEDRNREALSLATLGQQHIKLGEFQKALDYYNQARSLPDNLVSQWVQANVLNNLGSAYNLLNDKDQARQLHEKALEIFKRINDLSGQMMTSGYIGEIYYSLHDRENAAKFFADKLKIAETIGSREKEINKSNLSEIDVLPNNRQNTQSNFTFQGPQGRYFGVGWYTCRFNGMGLPIKQIDDRPFEANDLNRITSLGIHQNTFEHNSQLVPRETGHQEANKFAAGLRFSLPDDKPKTRLVFNLSFPQFQINPDLLNGRWSQTNGGNNTNSVYGFTNEKEPIIGRYFSVAGLYRIPDYTSDRVTGIVIAGNQSINVPQNRFGYQVVIQGTENKSIEAGFFTSVTYSRQINGNVNSHFAFPQFGINENQPGARECLLHGGLCHTIPGENRQAYFGLEENKSLMGPDRVALFSSSFRQEQLIYPPTSKQFSVSSYVIGRSGKSIIKGIENSTVEAGTSVIAIYPYRTGDNLNAFPSSQISEIRVDRANGVVDLGNALLSEKERNSYSEQALSSDLDLTGLYSSGINRGFRGNLVMSDLYASVDRPFMSDLYASVDRPFLRTSPKNNFFKADASTASPFSEKIKNNRIEASTLKDQGMLYELSGKKQDALKSYTKALELVQETMDRPEEAIMLNLIGGIYQQMPEKQQALGFYNAALKLIREVKDYKKEGDTLYNIARINFDLGDPEAAQDGLEKAIKIAEDLRTDIKSQRWRTQSFASKRRFYELKIEMLMQKYKQDPLKRDTMTFEVSEQVRARTLLESLYESQENIPQSISEEEKYKTLLQKKERLQETLQQLSEELVTLLNNNGASERISDKQLKITQYSTEYEEVKGKLRIINPYDNEVKPIQTLEAQQLLDPDTMLLEYFLGDKKSFLFVLTQNSIESFELPERSKIKEQIQDVYALLKTPEYSDKASFRGSGHALSLIKKSDDLPPPKSVDVSSAKMTGNGYFNFKSAKAEDDYVHKAEGLSRTLLGPIAKRLTSKRLVIVADDDLLHVAFNALPKPESTQKNGRKWTPLIVDHEIINLPSASTLAKLRKIRNNRQMAEKTLAIFADPVFEKDDERIGFDENKPEINSPVNPSTDTLPADSHLRGTVIPVSLDRLPYSRWEAQEILSLIRDSKKTLPAFDFDANLAAARNTNLGKYQILHFATHAIFYNGHPESCGIMLSRVDKQGKQQEGFLGAGEIMNLKLPVELVVLSACDTGLNKDVQWEDLYSITGAFMCAGASRVVISSWAVDDRATAEFMKCFYEEMLDKNQQRTIAAALREAQIKMWQKGRAPYYWAAFILQGEWEGGVSQ